MFEITPYEMEWSDEHKKTLASMTSALFVCLERERRRRTQRLYHNTSEERKEKENKYVYVWWFYRSQVCELPPSSIPSFRH